MIASLLSSFIAPTVIQSIKLLHVHHLDLGCVNIHVLTEMYIGRYPSMGINEVISFLMPSADYPSSIGCSCIFRTVLGTRYLQSDLSERIGWLIYCLASSAPILALSPYFFFFGICQLDFWFLSLAITSDWLISIDENDTDSKQENDMMSTNYNHSRCSTCTWGLLPPFEGLPVVSPMCMVSLASKKYFIMAMLIILYQVPISSICTI